MPRPMNGNRLLAGHPIGMLMSSALSRRVWGAALVTVLLGGCGGGSEKPATENPIPTAAAGGELVATAIRQTAPASACPNGGISVDAGIDKNANGVLDATEVTATQVACHGTNGNNAMVTTTPEAAGAHCSAGGKKVSVGLDSNGNSVLDEAEITSSTYVCDGASGNNGLGTLLTTITEPAGANCPNGGSKVSSGVDTNGNGTLEPGEMSATAYVCNNGNGPNPLLAIVAEPAGANCPSGGSKASSGLDSNNSGALDAAEVTSTRYVCSGQLWTGVSSGPLQTLPNQGYTALSVTTPLVLTLPANPAVDDVVRVVGAGAAGWQLAQNAGQSIVTSSIGAQAVTLASIGELWEPRAVNVNSVLQGSIAKRVAASADGQRVAVVNASQISRSLDGGLTWVNGPILSGADLTAVAASADGLRLVTMNSSLGVFTSTDGGVSWTPRGGPAVSYWRAVASSADGTRLVAADSNYAPPETSGFLYTSSDAGVTWTQRGTARVWTDVASSADGMRLVAASPQGLYTSSDAGVTWTARETTRFWQGVASSADGNKLVATVYGGQIYTSTDAGLTWVARNAGTSAVEPWTAVASSADGNRLVAVTGLALPGDGIFVSTDSGLTWAKTPAMTRRYGALAISADGSRLFANANSDLYVSAAQAYAPATTPGTDGALSGGQYSAVDLQYTGSGKWIILDHQGTLFVQ